MVFESHLQQLNLHAALHEGLDAWSHFHPGFIQPLENLQVLKRFVHLEQTQALDSH